MNQHTDIIDRFERGPARLREAIQGINAQELIAKPGPGAWSALELIIHLQDSDAIAIDRMKRVIAEDNPTLLGADESAYVQHLRCDAASLDDALTLIEVGRRQFVRILRSLDDAAFNRFGTHNVMGRVTLMNLINIYTEHLEYHLNFLTQKLARLRA